MLNQIKLAFKNLPKIFLQDKELGEEVAAVGGGRAGGQIKGDAS